MAARMSSSVALRSKSRSAGQQPGIGASSFSQRFRTAVLLAPASPGVAVLLAIDSSAGFGAESPVERGRNQITQIATRRTVAPAAVAQIRCLRDRLNGLPACHLETR